MRKTRKKRLSAQSYIEGILAADRIRLSQAITLVESRLPQDQDLAQEIMEAVLPHTGRAIRIGITGVPGVGKSTFIEAFGQYITSLPRKLAVLAVDPSSPKSRGSIMGDKTRMEQLSVNPLAYIRPSPARSSLGGVAQKTREALLLCEAAGFEVIMVETVGVGQSETMVHQMVDFFLLLMLAGAGDELQGIKKGIMEMADLIAINKADGENAHAAQMARQEYESALHLFPLPESGLATPVLTCSSLEEQGIAEIWEKILAHQAHTQKNGYFEKNRKRQNHYWMHDQIRYYLEEAFFEHPPIKKILPQLENSVIEGKTPVQKAVRTLLDIFQNAKKP